MEQRQTVLVFGGLLAHSWTARGAEILAMVNYRSLWETPKYEPPPFSSPKKRKKVTLTNSGEVKWESLFQWPEGKIPSFTSSEPSESVRDDKYQRASRHQRQENYKDETVHAALPESQGESFT